MERKRRPSIAVVLSLLCPGLGHVYAGRLRVGVAAWLVALGFLVAAKIVLLANFAGLLIAVCLLVTYQIAVAIHAGVSASRAGVALLGRYQRWYVYPALFLMVQGALAFLVIPVTDATLRYRAFRIPSAGMDPAIQIGDRIMVDMWHYRGHEPERGDVLVFKYPPEPTKDFIKRCVGTPGEIIEIREKVLFIDGAPVENDTGVHRDPFVFPSNAPQRRGERDHMSAMVVPPESVFVLGDNRDRSLDSRFWGPVAFDELRGRAAYIFWSSDLSRIGQAID